MIKINYMSTLFVGIDVSSKSNVVYAMDFEKTNILMLLSATTSLVLMSLPERLLPVYKSIRILIPLLWLWNLHLFTASI